MANRERGHVGFEALGKSWSVRYTTNAMCEIEDAFGKSIVQVGNDLSNDEGVHIKTLRTLFRIGVDGCEDDAHAGVIMDAIGIPKTGELIGEAFNAAFPEIDGEGEGKPRATGG